MRRPSAACATPACIRICAAIGSESPAPASIRMNPRRDSVPCRTRATRVRISASSMPPLYFSGGGSMIERYERRPGAGAFEHPHAALQVREIGRGTEVLVLRIIGPEPAPEQLNDAVGLDRLIHREGSTYSPREAAVTAEMQMAS